MTLSWTAGEMWVCPSTAQLYLPESSLLTDCSRSSLFLSLLSVNGCEFLYQMNVALSVRAQLLLHLRVTESPSVTLSGDSTWRSEHNTHIISSAADIHWLLFNIMHRRRDKPHQSHLWQKESLQVYQSICLYQWWIWNSTCVNPSVSHDSVWWCSSAVYLPDTEASDCIQGPQTDLETHHPLMTRSRTRSRSDVQ